ncbi:MAG: hypothetical protein H6819_06635 [Phycisphaerales bacterium]|nr:hypothetical protein [Phycisphaerales bacterium]MCB9855257.1 hypothetical protein [Phycisphaerales bacterium]MCB9862850.1 hypothetical protein [Phycisphaerales bacterium]
MRRRAILGLLTVVSFWITDIASATYPAIPRAENELGIAIDHVTDVVADDINVLRRNVERLSGAADTDAFVWQSLQPLDYNPGNPFSAATDIMPRFNFVLSATTAGPSDQSTDLGDPGVNPQPTSQNKPVAIGWNWNVNAGAAEIENPDYPAFGLRFEPWFRWPSGDSKVCEFHYQYNPSPQSAMYAAGRTGALRPLSIIVDHNTGTTSWDVDTSTFSWNLPSFAGNGTTQKVKLNLAGTPASLALMNSTWLDVQAGCNAVLSSTSYLRVGDSSNYIRLNANTSAVEFAGTSRPTMRIPLIQFIYNESSTGALYSTGSGATQRANLGFNDDDTDYYSMPGIIVGDDWDTSADWVVKLQISPANTTTTDHTIANFDFSVLPVPDNATFSSQTPVHSQVDAELDFGIRTNRFPKTFTAADGLNSITAAELSAAGVTGGTQLNFMIRRDAVDAKDTLKDIGGAGANVVYFHNLWLEVRKKRV